MCISALLAIAISPAFGQPSQKSQLSPSRLEYAKHVYSLLLKEVRYPSAARAGKLEGRAVVHFSVALDGRIKSRRVIKSSGHTILDQAALEAVDRLKQLPPFPPDMKKEAASQNFTLPITFRVSFLGKLFGLL
jgi:protein TonB